ncbi:protein of unknown function [Rhodovastum atsumiense]|nr:protein of unknown function [Rhodovastum atsumiense]
MGHRHLRCRPALGCPLFRGVQFRRDLHRRAGYLAWLRAPADHRRAAADGSQLRPAELARPRPALLPGSSGLAGITQKRLRRRSVSLERRRIIMARAVGFEPTTNRFGLLPRFLAVPDYVFTLGVTVRVSGARGRVIGWAPHRLVSTPSRRPLCPSSGLARRCPRLATVGFHRIHPIFD